MNWPGHDFAITLLYALISMICALLASAALALPAAGSAPVQILSSIVPVAVAVASLYAAAGIEPALTILIASTATIAIFVYGAIVLITPRPGGEVPPAQSPSASLVLPIALVLILAGFWSHLTVATCIGLVVLGVLAADLTRTIALPATSFSTPPRTGWSLAVPVAALPLALLFFTIQRCWASADTAQVLRLNELAVTSLLCPAMLVPLLRRSLHIAHDGHTAEAVGMASSAIVLLLGLLLPGMVVADYLIRRWNDESALLAGLPQLSWRLDIPLLVAGGFGLLAMRLDMLRPHRWVGFLLILVYVAYLLTGSMLRLF
jgi:hypothetical protein